MKVMRIARWASTGPAFIWINAAAVAISLLMASGLLLLLAVNGLGHFWPKAVMRGHYLPPATASTAAPGAGDGVSGEFFGELIDSESVSAAQLRDTGFAIPPDTGTYQRQLLRLGNQQLDGQGFGWVVTDFVTDLEYPPQLTVLEHRSRGRLYGFLQAIQQQQIRVVTDDPAQTHDDGQWLELQQRLQRVARLHARIGRLERREIARVNQQTEQLRLHERRLALQGLDSPEALAELARRRHTLELQFVQLQASLDDLYQQVNRDSVVLLAANRQQLEIPLGDIVRAWRPNAMTVTDKLALYFVRLTEFLTTEPRAANTAGGIFPAIFGTVVMVLLMSVLVMPFGVIAAIYLREYAHQGLLTRMIRIAVNNLAGVPSIVYGVFGLGFFIYIVGAEIDRLFHAEALPAPTFGTPGLLWAALTLALLNVPVVIVATEEGLARIPQSLREGSLALGATRFETLVKVVFPIASPAMLTGLILAIARAAGEVAPLMLVGVVKLAPALPINGIYPYFHLDQKFMHLGYHIYDVAFQSPDVEATRPLVFATALLLVTVIAVLNISAAILRNRLRERYKALDV